MDSSIISAAVVGKANRVTVLQLYFKYNIMYA